MTTGYWGNVTAAINWCEKDYVVSRYIAEFWNSVSNLPFILLAVAGLYHSFYYRLSFRNALQYIAFGIVGLGSFLFHATLRFHAQMWDEVPMVWRKLDGECDGCCRCGQSWIGGSIFFRLHLNHILRGLREPSLDGLFYGLPFIRFSNSLLSSKFILSCACL